MARNLSEVYEYHNKLFRYDYDNCLVTLVYKVTDEMLEDNREWQEKYGKDLWDIVDGYHESCSVGLRKENWDNQDIRDEYLFEWAEELDEETRCMAEDFLRYG